MLCAFKVTLKYASGRVQNCSVSNAGIVRNSWNTNWGLEGFIHLTMGENTCNLASDPTTVVIK